MLRLREGFALLPLDPVRTRLFVVPDVEGAIAIDFASLVMT
jgi:hypothetical protein